jgi:predicted nucleotidyltransferase
MRLASELEEWATLIASWAETKPTIAEAWLFGSRVRGDNAPDSDLDVAVVMAGVSKGAR